MKWFFGLNELTLTHHDHDMAGLVLAAAASALANTKLEPHFIYDGGENEMTAQLRAMGVTIIPHRITFHAAMAGSASAGFNILIAAGAYLRTEIPILETHDEFALYTDCDVLFMRQPSFLHMQPAYFACAPQFSKNVYEDLNTGVMLMNLKQLRQDWPAFRTYIVENFEAFEAFDQGAYKTFYPGRYELLPPEANWKPYWGRNDNAEIVHFHGPKPLAVRKALVDPVYALTPTWRDLFERDRDAYRHYLDLWDHYYSVAYHLIRALPGATASVSTPA